MLETMIADLVQNLNITNEMFVKACTQASKDPLNRKHIELILTATDYSIFKKYMEERNKEISEKAIKILNDSEKSKKIDIKTREEAELALALKQSIQLDVNFFYLYQNIEKNQGIRETRR